MGRRRRAVAGIVLADASVRQLPTSLDMHDRVLAEPD